LPLIVAAWFGMTGLLAHASGWARLARSFRATLPASGERFRFASGSMGGRILPVNYGGCLFIAVSEAGIHLSLLYPFRFQSPALFLPWSQVESVAEKTFIFSTYTAIRVRGHWPTISVRGRAGQFIRGVYAQVSASARGA
jgi:hypothetical protein